MIKAIHFADVHVGMENYGSIDPKLGTSSRVRDFLNRMDEVIEYGQLHDIDLWLFAGDAFKTRDPNPTLFREFAIRVQRMAQQAPIIVLVGNHDMPGMAQRANSLDIFDLFDDDNIILANTPEKMVIETKSGPVYAAWLPYPMRNRLLPKTSGKTIDEMEDEFRDAVEGIVQHLAGAASGQGDIPRVFMGHFTTSEAMFGSERAVMIGRDIAVGTELLRSPEFDYVALGHIHKHQEVGEGYPSIVYSGSLERIDFGEEKEDKGFVFVELERNSTKWQFVPVSARRFLTVKVNVTESDDPTARVLEAMVARYTRAEDAVVKLVITMRSDQQQSLNMTKIEKELERASHASIIRNVEQEERTRLAETGYESMTPLELTERYFQIMNTDQERVPDLVTVAEGIFSESDI